MKLLAALMLSLAVGVVRAADVPASGIQAAVDPPIPFCLKVFVISRDLAKWKSQRTYSEMTTRIVNSPVNNNDEAEDRGIMSSVAPRLYNDPLVEDLDPQEVGVFLYNECKKAHPEDPLP